MPPDVSEESSARNAILISSAKKPQLRQDHAQVVPRCAAMKAAVPSIYSVEFPKKLAFFNASACNSCSKKQNHQQNHRVVDFQRGLTRHQIPYAFWIDHFAASLFSLPKHRSLIFGNRGFNSYTARISYADVPFSVDARFVDNRRAYGS
ncbi:hypothetical protein VLK31_28130 [Variovorax sp. H27-G14]|uniref:hypothetical protein n=1 Tax=Variovorax sp. H27-G14 TaxID=3111914 RepID=UPI0038FCFD41